MLLVFSSSVKFSLGVRLLNLVSTSCILVRLPVGDEDVVYKPKISNNLMLY
jgi:hypothetical protein